MLLNVLFLSLVLKATASPAPLDDSSDSNVGIVGGQPAPNGAYPHLVSLRKPNGMHNCAGSIINNRWIVSAAHCSDSPNKVAFIVAGSNRLDTGGTQYQPERIINHERYNNPRGANDISLIKVASDIAFNDKVRPISLPQSVTGPESSVVAAGFGATQGGGTSSPQMMHVTIRTMSNDQCARIMGFAIPETQICTYASGQGICQGDSGGPLMEAGTLVGVVSWSSVPCGTNADGYTRVSSYINWIQSHMN